MKSKPQETEFLKHLRAEKLLAQETRAKYVFNKLAYAAALLGIGSLGIKLEYLDLRGILYLVPLVALVFDFYIMGEDYSVKRLGGFLGANSSDPLEHRWEQWVFRNRDPLAPVAMPILTTLLLAGSAAIIVFIVQDPATQRIELPANPLYWTWITAIALLTWGIFIFYSSKRKRVPESIARAMDSISQPIQPLQQLVAAVKRADYRLDRTTYRRAQRLFTSCLSDPRHLQYIQKIAPEYGQPEFLQNVDSHGIPVTVSDKIMKEFQETRANSPEFDLWFREEKSGEQTKPVLLIARWLCHLVGFRHTTVQLFIDPPHLAEHTLIQVRAADRPESPGCFDIPVAGHVPDSASVEDTVFTELMEELGLAPDALEEFTQLGSHNQTVLHNVEHCVIFYSRLSADAWPRLNATSPEVAAVATFALTDLEKMMVSFPERIASGLKHAFPFYRKHKMNPVP